MVYVIRDIVKECRANLEDEDEDDWDGLLDDIQAFAGGDDACEVEEEAERTEEVKAEITNQIESLQRVFESLFRYPLRGSFIVDCSQLCLTAFQ